MTGTPPRHPQSAMAKFSTHFPDYDVVKELGRGGMGVVYKARHKINGHFVVIKTMLKGGDDHQTQRFQREAEVLAELKHHNIVSVKTVGQSSGEYYFVMEYIEGQNLRNLVAESLRKSGAVPDINRIIEIIAAIAQGLVECHEKGIVHRDVKPENIVIGPDRPVLVDFGLVKQMDSQFDTTVENLTKTGQMLGTPGFMPPEQLEFNGEYGQIGPASDVWSLGATLYYCLSGQQPFGSLPFSAWCMAVVDRNPPSVKTLNPALPDWISELCSDCLERKPSQRLDMKTLVRRLELRERNVRKQSFLKGFSAAILLGVAAFVILAGLFGQDVENPLVDLKSKTKLFSRSASDPITVIGRVIDRDPHCIYVNSKRYELTKSGAFKVTLERLKQGDHTLTLIAEDSSGNLSSPMTIQAKVDWTSPSYALQSVAVEDDVLSLQGEVSEELKSLTINGEDVALKARRFRHTIPVSEVAGDLQLKLIDKVGHETNGSPDNLYIVGPKSRAKSLAKALQFTKPGGTIVLMSGFYRVHSEIDKNVSIFGLTGQTSVVLRTEQPIRINNGSRVSLKNLSLEGTRKGAAATLYIHGGAEVTIDLCRVSSVGLRAIQLQGSERMEAMPSVRIQRSTIHRSVGPGLVAVRGKIWAKDCRFKDPGPSLQANGDWAAGGVELRGGSSGHFENCQFNDSLDRGVYLQSSTGEFVDCEFKRSMCEGAMLRKRARATFRRCQFIHNSFSGVFIVKQSYAEFVDCQFVKNGNEGSALERTNGLRIFGESVVHLVNTEVRDHLNKGVVLRNSKLNIYKCRIVENAGGNIFNYESVITRKAPRQ